MAVQNLRKLVQVSESLNSPQLYNHLDSSILLKSIAFFLLFMTPGEDISVRWDFLMLRR